MEIVPVDLTRLVPEIMGLSLVLIPVMGATIRFAAKPLVDALLQAGFLSPRQQQPLSPGGEAELARLSRRVLELEQALAQRLPAAASSELAPPEPVELRRIRP